MNTDQLKTHARRFLEEVWNGRNPDAAADFMTDDFRQDRPLPGVSPDRDGVEDWVRTTLQAFPDIHFTIDEQVAEGDTVVTRWTARGTHQETFMGIPATGKKVVVEGLTVGRYAGGKVQSDYVQWDKLGMMQQLGVIPSMSEGATA